MEKNENDRINEDKKDARENEGQGTMMEGEVFRRRESIPRSPPGMFYRERSNSVPSQSTATLPEKTTKRMREGSGENGREELAREIERVTKTVNELLRITEASTKTKLEIKNCVKKLKRYTNDLCKEWKRVENQECMTIPTKPEMRSMGVQVGVGDIQNEYEVKKIETRNRIETVLKEEQTFANLAEILDEKWPQEVYKITQVDDTSQTTLHQPGDYVLLIDTDNIQGNKVIEKVMLKYSGLTELVAGSDGQMDFLTQTATIKTSKKEYQEESSTVYLLPMKIDVSGVNDMEEVYNRMKELAQAIRQQPTVNINMVVGDGLKHSYVRKTCEYIFTKEEVKIKLLVQGHRSEPKKQRTRSEESIVTVKTEGKSYVDMVKRLQEEVDIEKLGVRIRKVRRTGKGDVQLAVEGGQQMAKTLEGEIRNRLEEVNVTTRSTGKTVLYIMGIDSASDEEDVKLAMMKETGLQEADINIKSIKTGKYEEQTAVIEVPKGQATTLIKKRKLGIGWTQCTVKERIQVIRCYRCLEFGHRTYECTAQEGRGEDCIKCGQKGHKSRDCGNSDHCIKCKMDGHRMDQMKCPHFRAIVEKMRIERIHTGGKKVRGDRDNANGT